MSLITGIQKYCIHDGDGIRTTVFFKGCPLKCLWCHNPETQRYQKEASYDAEKCLGCGSCLQACPESAISEEAGKMTTDPKRCTCCATCTDYCNLNLREIIGESYSVDELIKELKKDEMFYEESGGGVTLSGGEVMTSDMDYLEELTSKLYRAGIRVLIDTCGFAPYENFQRILPFVDGFLYDIKTMDADRHRTFVGTDNVLILENLERLSRDGANLYIRVPVISEVNGTREDMRAVAKFLSDKRICVKKINLLPYHNTGSGKYEKIGKIYEGCEFHAPNQETMETLAEVFRAYGFQNVKIGG